jgi:hemerythrin superfamily protein
VTATRASKTARAAARTGQTKAGRRKSAARAAASRSARKTRAPKPTSRLRSAATVLRGRVAGAVAAVAERLPWTSGDVDALRLLESDHRRFEDLFEKGEATTARAGKSRTELLGTLTAELTLHELLEEKLLYPALKDHPEATEVVLEGYQEHHVADLIVTELHDVATDDERWAAKFKVLKENIEHHIEEEESSMFPTARAVLSREELHDLGRRMTEMIAEVRQGDRRS